MTKEDVITELESLMGHCGNMAKDLDNDEVWNKDTIALEIAINALKELWFENTQFLNPAGKYAIAFAKNHGISFDKAMESPMVKARFEYFNQTGR